MHGENGVSKQVRDRLVDLRLQYGSSDALTQLVASKLSPYVHPFPVADFFFAHSLIA